jgi:prevent-host-death family protein
LQEAKARLSELIRRARTEGPQTITVHGEEVAVVQDSETYRREHPEPKQSSEFGSTLQEILRNAPKLRDEEVDYYFCRNSELALPRFDEPLT